MVFGWIVPTEISGSRRIMSRMYPLRFPAYWLEDALISTAFATATGSVMEKREYSCFSLMIVSRFIRVLFNNTQSKRSTKINEA